MNLTTRERIINAATSLFAETGYRGASVRDICNLAGTNPGAVSYHFGGKRQLYRAVLRQAAERLAARAAVDGAGVPEERTPEQRALAVAAAVQAALEAEPAPVRLVLRDLADGGGAAVEALSPVLRHAAHWLGAALGEGDSPGASVAERLAFLEIAAPIFLFTGAWPILVQALGLVEEDRHRLLGALLRRAIVSR